MRARDGREDERKYEWRRRRRRRIESVRWRWMTDRTMRRGFTEEAGNPKKKKRKKIKMKGRRRREEVPHPSCGTTFPTTPPPRTPCHLLTALFPP